MDCYLTQKQVKTVQLNTMPMKGNGPCENAVTGIRTESDRQNVATVAQNLLGVLQMTLFE